MLRGKCTILNLDPYMVTGIVQVSILGRALPSSTTNTGEDKKKRLSPRLPRRKSEFRVRK